MTSEHKWIRQLMRAAREGDLPVVTRLIETWGVPVDVEAFGAGGTALHQAAAFGQLEVVAHLLSAGASPNALDSSGWGPLVMPCANGHLAVVRALIDAGADVETHAGRLLAASMRCRDRPAGLAITRALLAAGAPPDAMRPLDPPDRQDSYAAPPLVEALSSQRYDLALALVEAGSDVRVRPNRRPSVLAMGVRGGPALTEALLDGGASLEAGDNGISPVAVAAHEGCVESLALLWGVGVDLRAPDPHGWTPLMHAASSGQGAAARWLVEREVQLDVLEAEGRGAHTLARLGGHGALADWLAALGAPVQPEFDAAVAQAAAEREEQRREEAEFERKKAEGRWGRITGGTFKDFQGLIIGEQRGQLVVSVTIFGRRTEVRVSPDQFEEDPPSSEQSG